jgi:uncharacterized membrane protein YfcA
VGSETTTRRRRALVTLSLSRMLQYLAHPTPFMWGPFLFYLIGCCFSGVAVGAVGIGGVMLTPMLMLLVELRVAVPAVLASFLITQPLAVLYCAQQGTLRRRPAILVAIGASFGAVLGALLLHRLPATPLALLLSAIAATSGASSGVNAIFELHLVQSRGVKLSHELPYAVGRVGEDCRDNIRIHENGAKAAQGIRDHPGQLAAGMAVGDPEGGGDPLLNMCTAKPLRRTLNVKDLSLIQVGFVAATFSVITGTGGGFITLPILFCVRPEIPTVEQVALGHTVGVPVSLSTFISAFVLQASIAFLGPQLCSVVVLKREWQRVIEVAHHSVDGGRRRR